MKVTVKNDLDKVEYPCLMISEGGRVVLFSEPECGVALTAGVTSATPSGHYYDAWNMHNFKLFNGSIILENGQES